MVYIVERCSKPGMENLENINTVQDLLDANSKSIEQIEGEELLDTVLKAGPSVAHGVACGILTVLRNYHMEATSKYIKDGNADVVAAWAADATALELALNAISDIQL